MKRLTITFFLFLISILNIESEESVPFARSLSIGTEITLRGELIFFNGWQPNIRFITDNNEIIGIGKDESYSLPPEANEIIKDTLSNGKVSKIQIDLQYIGDVSLPYYDKPLMCFSIIKINQKYFLNDTNIVKLGNTTIQIYQPDYTANDLLSIASIGDNTSTTCIWGINKSYLQKQLSFTKEEVYNKVDINKLIDTANYFIENAYNHNWKNKLFLSSISLQNVVDNINIKSRNDFIFVFTYKSQLNSNSEDEKIFMLPNGAIVLSSTNYEYIKY
jgi:hypothetical protein